MWLVPWNPFPVKEVVQTSTPTVPLVLWLGGDDKLEKGQIALMLLLDTESSDSAFDDPEAVLQVYCFWEGQKKKKKKAPSKDNTSPWRTEDLVGFMKKLFEEILREFDK